MMVALKCLLITVTSSCAFSMMLCRNTQSCTRVSVLGENPAHYIISNLFRRVVLFPCVCFRSVRCSRGLRESVLLKTHQKLCSFSTAALKAKSRWSTETWKGDLHPGALQCIYESICVKWIKENSCITVFRITFIWHESLERAESRSYAGLFPAGREKWLDTMSN